MLFPSKLAATSALIFLFGEFSQAALRNSYEIQVDLPFLIGDSFGVPAINRTFDYVIVGGGTAGLALAYRLAVNNSVAVVEAGGFYQTDNGNGSTIPALCTSQFVGPDPNDYAPLIDWGYATVPQSGIGDRRVLYPRGKTFGGSSARNYMAYHLPTRGSLDAWADEVGDASFAFNNTFQYFAKSIQLTPADLSKRAANASTEFTMNPFNTYEQGPLPVSWPNYGDPYYTWAAKAFPEAGLPIDNSNFLDGKLSGLTAWSASTIDPVLQQRSTSATSYLRRSILETDLVAYPRTLAKEIVFDSNVTATGVRVDAGGRDFFLQARNEVILSAGALNTPQLLMVSGIGPADVLATNNITVRKQLEGVGQNLQDHILFPTTYQVNVQSLAQLADPIDAQRIRDEYLQNRTGVLTGPPGFLSWERIAARNDLGLTPTTAHDFVSSHPADWPDTEYLISAGPAQGPASSPSTTTFGNILVGLISPFSRGTVTINSTDTADPPLIDPRWLTDPRDVEWAVAALKRTRQIWPGLSGITIGPEILPGTNITSDAQITAFVKQTLGTIYHPSATCKMGKSNDPMAVLDSKARVYGTQNLRVVDASAFPFLTPGHPQSVVYMLAEKIADDILNCQ